MTYSILARDPESGETGVATQSQAFAVGSSVPFALPGHGVIASQSMGEPVYGEIGLELLRGGFTARETLTALTSVDPHPDRRQVGVLDVAGGAAVFTGRGCVEAAGHLEGEHCVALANMVTGPAVWEALVTAFEASSGPLSSRLLTSLHAAEDAGGDFRGRRSAAVMVVRSTTTGRPWQDTVVDLRVDESPDPVAELDRLVHKRRRYQDVVRAFQQALDGDAPAADRELDELRPQDPRVEPDQAMWRAVVAALAGREEVARGMLVELEREAPQFVEAARRLGPAGLVPQDVLDRVLPRVVP